MPQRPNVSLPQQISRHFTLDDLRGFGYDLALDFENLRGETKDARALALVELCDRTGQTARLLALCREKRPHLNWRDFQPTAPAHDAIRQQYRQHLAARYQYLDFRGMGQAGHQCIRLALETVYVPLNGRINRLLGGSSRAECNQPDAVQPLLTLLQKNPGLIVLGSPAIT